jgi:hypothetical protein
MVNNNYPKNYQKNDIMGRSWSLLLYKNKNYF